MSGITQSEMLKQKIEAYHKIIDDLSDQLAHIESERNQLVQVLSTMQGYLESYENEHAHKASKNEEKPQAKAVKLDLSNHSMSEGVKAILEFTGKPMHVKDITTTIIASGKNINSKNPVNVIYAVISKRKKWFRKVGPSVFALVKEGALEQDKLFR